MSNKLIDNKELMQEYDYERNKDFDLNKLTLGSDKKIWWKCFKCGYEWQASICSRKNHTGCPNCGKKKMIESRLINKLTKDGSFETNFPQLAKEWDYSRNNLPPNNYTKSSKNKVWWVCEKGHSYYMSISNKAKGYKCPICSGHKVLSGYNDLATLDPEVLKFWDYKKNTIDPKNISLKSNKKVWWICSKNHHFLKSVNNMVTRRSTEGCPYCNNQKILVGFNDLETTNPQLAKEWNYEKNYPLTPRDVFEKSKKTVWWICKKGHEWKSKLYSRSSGIGCPICNNETHTSFPEQAIYYYLSKFFDVQNRKKVFGKEIDIFLPKYNIGIEYDGQYYHKNKREKDKEKSDFLIKNGINLFRIIENQEKTYYDHKQKFYYKYSANNYNDLNNIIEQLLNILFSLTGNKYEKISIDIEKSKNKIKSQYLYLEKNNSILSKDKNLINYWDKDKNENINIEYISYGTTDSYWWTCPICKNSWKRVPNRMIGKGCPYCSGKIIKSGFNDFATLFPGLIKEWNYEKNNVVPNSLSPNSNKKVWWKCSKCGYEWQTTIAKRTNGTGCPVCSNNKIIVGVNDLSTLNPLLAREWNYEKNMNLLPTQVTIGTKKRVWWKCSKCGYEWQAYIYNRNRGNACPKCSKKEQNELKNKNNIIKNGSLKTLYPELMNEWYYEKNKEIGLFPEKIQKGSHKKAYWKCSNCGLVWQTQIYNRTSGHGCPKCSKKKK